MKDIYASASLVIIWTGTEDDDSDDDENDYKAFDLMDGLVNLLDRVEQTEDEEEAVAQMQRFRASSKFRANIESLRMFLLRPWIARVWTLQELFSQKNGSVE